jgi:hypothetical protein
MVLRLPGGEAGCRGRLPGPNAAAGLLACPASHLRQYLGGDVGQVV